MTRLLILLLSLLSLCSQAEDLNGIWKGTLTQGPGGCYPTYFLELQINFTGDRITGKAYDYYDKAHFVKMSFTGRYNAQTHRLVLIEDRVLESDIPGDCSPCMKTYDLDYTRNGAIEELTGDWKGFYSEKHLICPPGKIKLQKATASDFPVDVDQNDTLAGLQATLHLQPRQKAVVKTVTVSSSQIKIELYDDAVIDHDTVTVLINGKLLLYRQMLTDRPLTINFNAFPNIPYELVMYADNLGDIPPNTALMMVTAGSQKFEVFLSSTEEKSAAVRFVYRP
ncbi:hypothetical protein [Puia dinghuensis]|uniref:Lipocalin-like domain-containing protein n=1 Tax=Puia dinghuensis TaxID=1792502 RepID=A0A8J2U881_9BACT|nr:hypothetical protein [Puia dinghuensis]GGA86139.1 hypothetical protein GCM10011511_06490 [Puia dinghuensis]